MAPPRQPAPMRAAVQPVNVGRPQQSLQQQAMAGGVRGNAQGSAANPNRLVGNAKLAAFQQGRPIPGQMNAMPMPQQGMPPPQGGLGGQMQPQPGQAGIEPWMQNQQGQQPPPLNNPNQMGINTSMQRQGMPQSPQGGGMAGIEPWMQNPAGQNPQWQQAQPGMVQASSMPGQGMPQPLQPFNGQFNGPVQPMQRPTFNQGGGQGQPWRPTLPGAHPPGMPSRPMVSPPQLANSNGLMSPLPTQGIRQTY